MSQNTTYNKPSGAPSKRNVRGRPFQEGNPGRPKGARNKRTIALEAILEGEADAIVKKTAEMARDGDHVALRLCFDRILGTRRDRTVTLDLPPIETISDCRTALAATVAAVADGAITPGEASEISELISTTIKVLETAQFEERLTALEEAFAADPRYP